MDDLKWCSKCKTEKEYWQFNADKSKPDGLYSSCKDCRRNTPKKRKTRDLLDPVRLEKARAWTRLAMAARRAIDPQKENDRLRNWRRDNPEKFRASQKRYRLKKRSAISSLTAAQWEWLLEKSGRCCVYCGQHESECGKLHQEHIIPVKQGGAYTVTNIVPACASCNHKKNSKTPQQAGMEIVIKINPLKHMKQERLFE